ncbi:hypothetical protein L6164_023657 [Bauhinia variegata]|uniref:Uncharacterized protein n=1 Tax=Bauhinia variegata TaxID=167791 RepID=A0ACB9MK93_BAUVA|nr:hypothetical protein L6164_023657 [Bauhinia variegata]
MQILAGHTQTLPTNPSTSQPIATLLVQPTWLTIGKAKPYAGLLWLHQNQSNCPKFNSISDCINYVETATVNNYVSVNHPIPVHNFFSCEESSNKCTSESDKACAGSNSSNNSFNLWHMRLGHPSKDVMQIFHPFLV